MKKSLFNSLLSLSIAFALQAQTEPEKRPLTGKSPAAGTKKTPANPQPVQASGTKSAEAGTKPADDTNAKPIDPSNMDPSVKPADDFFLYANGGWIKRTEIPPEYSRWGSFNQLIEHNNDALHAIAEKAAKAKSNEADAKKVGDYYASGMDEKTIEAMRTKPLEDEFKSIDAIKDRNDLLKAVAHLHTIGVDALFDFTSGQDAKDSAREIAQAVQGGLGMPDRDYYTKTDEASKKLRDQYVDHVAKMLTLLGEPAATASNYAKKILALETRLAQASRTRVQLRDPQKNYNKL